MEPICIYHYPGPIEENPGVGSQLRPLKMLEAFRSLGYRVEVVSGDSRQRRQKIRQLKARIRAGERFQFLYGEDRNIPYALSDEDHIPRHPFLDLSFLGFCRSRGIPVGVFYRDLHWKFPQWRQAVSLPKRCILLPLFRMELARLNRVTDIAYLPSRPVQQYIFESHPHGEPLPPGAEERPIPPKSPQKGRLRVFYVGSVTGCVYDIRQLCQAVRDTENVTLTLCTPEAQWAQAQKDYAPYLCDRITVIHETSAHLAPCYAQADLMACCLQDNPYIAIGMPIKVFESIGTGTPVLITANMAAADLVEQEGCGWKVSYSAQAIGEVFRRLLAHPEELARKAERTAEIACRHTWAARARQAAEQLTKLQEKKL